MSTTNEVRLTQLDLLREAKGLLPDEEIADRARRILDGLDPDDEHFRAVIGRAVEAYERQRMFDRNTKAIQDEIEKGPIFPRVPFGRVTQNIVAELDIPSTRVGLADYLIQKGHSGPGVARLIVDFERAVAKAYATEYGEYPLRENRVFIFDTADRPLIDRVYDAKINAIAEASGVELR